MYAQTGYTCMCCATKARLSGRRYDYPATVYQPNGNAVASEPQLQLATG